MHYYLIFCYTCRMKCKLPLKRFCLTVVIIAACITGNPAWGQNIRFFSSDSSEYIAELGSFFSQLINKEIRAKSMNEFSEFKKLYSSEILNTGDLTELYRLSKSMTEKNLKAYPHLFQLISMVNVYSRNQSTGVPDINSFVAGLATELKKNSTRDFEQTLENLFYLITQSFVYYSSNIKWQTSSRQFEFVYNGVLLARMDDDTLKGFSRMDTVEITGTTGTIDLLTNHFKGSGGRVTWKRAKLDTTRVYAILSDYSVDLKTGKVTAYDTKLYYRDFFDQPLTGVFEDQVLTFRQPVISFPKFNSDSPENYIKNLVTDVDARGIFRLEGSMAIIAGNEFEPAQMWFRKKHQDQSGFYNLIRLGSKSFGFDGSKITSLSASVSIYHENDSIYHPSVSLAYYDSSRMVTLSRSENDLGICPFIDSYHNVDFKTGMIAWDMDLDEMILTSVPSLRSDFYASFESDNFFSEPLFDQLKGIDNQHPLFVLKELSENLGSRVFHLDDVARAYNITSGQIEPLIFELAAKGYLFYNFETKLILIRERVFHALNSKSKKRDYDVIRFNSLTDGLPNARLNLRNFELNIEGVNDIRLSDAQKVLIMPSDKRLIFRKNRDFAFSGKIEAGLFDFYSAQCVFSYDSFLIRMPVIDSMLFKVRPFPLNEKSNTPYILIKNVIANISGWLYIDSATNKSGLKPLNHYPVFICDKEAYVYYDRKSIQNGVYLRDSFYYYLKPFTIDSLLTFKTDGIQFAGKLISGGIFPDIEQPLKVQPDYSLGFVYRTPIKGLPVYRGAGVFRDTVFLSNDGLKGSGRLNFLNSEIVSDDFTFLPDDISALTRKAQIAASVSGQSGYPSMLAEQVKVNWKPYEQLAIYQSVRKKISLFENRAQLEGSLTYQPERMSASGKLSFSDAILESAAMSLSRNEVHSDTSRFFIEAPGKSGYVFTSVVDKANINFETRISKFRTSGANSKVEFPVNQFMANMDEFEWHMDKNMIYLKNNIAQTLPEIDQLSLHQLIDTDFKGSEFISTSPAMDSLQFYTVNASYDLKENLLSCENVKIIHVADAALFPGDGKVQIGKNGRISPLENATIITKNKFHRFNNVTVSITSRTRFTGKGSYEYISKDETVQVLTFDKISVDSAGRTMAAGSVAGSMNFRFSPQFDFKGETEIVSTIPDIRFKGNFRINSECLGNPDIWIRMDAGINPKNIRIPVGEVIKDSANNHVYAAIFYSVINSKIYPSFFNRRSDYTDSLLFTANGFLTYDDRNRVFSLGNTDTTGVFSGNHLHFSETRCELSGTGKISTGAGIKPVDLSTYGTIKYSYINDSTSLQVAASLNFFFSEPTLELMAENINQSEIPVNEKFSENYLIFSGNGTAGSAAHDAASQLITRKKNMETMMRTLVFSDLTLFWNKNTRSYQSAGPVSLASILKYPVNKTLNGNIEIEKRRGGDILSVYLEPDRREYYFFKYSDNVMQSISSELPYNSILRELDEKDRKSGEVTGSTEYRFIISTTQRKNEFIRKFRDGSEE